MLNLSIGAIHLVLGFVALPVAEDEAFVCNVFVVDGDVDDA
jgi:hypothetical protein